ncbi:dihydrofolate synthase / folylpolyglutamate synthase [Gammaproteobacteria bacterium]
MLATAIKTHKVKPGESLFTILDTYVAKLAENTIIAIASKVISICENRLVSKNKNKLHMIRRESDFCFAAPLRSPTFYLTLKDNRLVPNAGIDESNCNNAYVLLPKKPQLTAKKIWQHLRKRDSLKNLGVIIADSNITPLRRGVTGIAIGWCGFKPIYDYIGQKDIFDRQLQVTQINLLDSLATVATVAMGEGREQTPIAIVKNAPKINFQNRAPTTKEEQTTCIGPKNDLFSTVDFALLKDISYE